ncbi:MAG: protein phosphatase CheZ [Undibacterium sp.]|uniref:protein phosphatase CheZ n=1 Tax=Undibacterium sp. TaxID=1914977 RepID=UPI0027280F4E|nr:protein phosphatase CheZ [Undibacterium sp.]MDO8652982.1 protein phosphatase CheZ [Undibacterium sp.]
MTDSVDDLDALFEEMANQRVETQVSVSQLSAQTLASATLAPSKLMFHSTEDQSAKPIFDRLGGLVRMMHESMRELGYDRSLSDVASQISDAQGRLEYVATLTEQAANKVLNATDLGMPEQDVLAKNAKTMDARWENLFSGNMSVDEFKLLAADSKTFANTVISSTDAEKARLLEIMMAQDFQDLTGQLIKKVLIITQAVERELAQILIDNAPLELKEKAIELMEGPSAPHAALEQDDVDNLLDSLGF